MTDQQKSDITAQIRFREALLDCVLHLRDKSRSRSDLGWLMSIATAGVGTITAVLNGKKAQQYSNIIRELERDITFLKVQEQLGRFDRNDDV